MTEPFDPAAPLPGPPDPWVAAAMPSLREGPPYHMTEMIAAEPGLTRRLLAALADPVGPAAELAADLVETASAGRPILATGCGTSEHGALAFVEIVRAALIERGLTLGPGGLVAAQAFELALDPPAAGVVVAISHEGATAATNRALAESRAAGARTALVTVSDRSPGAAFADLVVTTGELDRSWCHTVGYLSPILAAAAVGAHVTGRVVDPREAAGLVAAAGGPAAVAAADALAGRLAVAEHLVVVASGADRVAGRELVLKVEEASWLPAAYRDLETFLHGHLPATGGATGLVLVLTDRAGREERLGRARSLLAAAGAVGVRAGAILAAGAARGLDERLTPAGRLIVPEAPGLPSPVAALVGSAPALQLLTERLARARGTNPDPIRRDDPRYLAASAAAE